MSECAREVLALAEERGGERESSRVEVEWSRDSDLIEDRFRNFCIVMLFLHLYPIFVRIQYRR